MLALLFTEIVVISTLTKEKKSFKMKAHADNLYCNDFIYIDNEEYRIIDIKPHYSNVT